MRIYLSIIPVKFHHDPIWNNRDLGFFEDGSRKKKSVWDQFLI